MENLYLSQHRKRIYDVVSPMDWIVMEPETPNCCQLVADREVFLPGWKSCLLIQHRTELYGVEDEEDGLPS